MKNDLISRQAAITLPIMPKEYRKHKPMDCDDAYEQGWGDCQSCIGRLPTAEPRKGKWERHYSRPNVYADLFWHCSECGYKNDENYAPVYHHYCPNCGARMEET